MTSHRTPLEPGVRHPDRKSPDALRVAFDVTPMIGARTGVGNLVAGFRRALAARSDVELVPYATTIRGRREVMRELDARLAPVPARVLRLLWSHTDWPPVERLSRAVGTIDMVHGMNYVVPPTRSHHSLVSVHDLTVVRFPEMCTPDTLQYPGLLRRAFRRGAHVHVDSRFVGDEVAAWSGLSPDRIHVVGPGLTPTASIPEVPGPGAGVGVASPDPSRPTQPTRVERLVGRRPFILGLGTVEPRKDFPTLLRAFAEVAAADPDLLLVIAGGNGWGSAAFDILHAGLEPAVRSRIVRLGYVDDSEKDVLLRSARVLAYPSVYEGFGLPPLEAMQLRTPVVSSDAGSLPEVLGDAARFVRVGDHSQLAAELLRVHNDESLRLLLAARGAEQASRYTWARAGDEMLAAYGHVVGRSPA